MHSRKFSSVQSMEQIISSDEQFHRNDIDHETDFSNACFVSRSLKSHAYDMRRDTVCWLLPHQHLLVSQRRQVPNLVMLKYHVGLNHKTSNMSEGTSHRRIFWEWQYQQALSYLCISSQAVHQQLISGYILKRQTMYREFNHQNTRMIPMVCSKPRSFTVTC